MFGAVKKCKSEKWYLLNRKIGIYVTKLFKAGKSVPIKHFRSKNWGKKFQWRVGKFYQKFLNWKIGFEKFVSL